MAEREYDILLACTVTKTVRVKASSMAECRGIIYDRLGDGQHIEAFDEVYGAERVVDVVRAGDPWHFEREPEPHVVEEVDHGPIERCRECGREEWGHSWLDHMK